MMLSSTLNTGIVATVALFATLIHGQAAPTPTVPVGPITTLGCYKGIGNLKNEGSATFQTSGSCQAICANAGYAVMATTQGSFCYCGSALPPSTDETDSSSCSSPCNGYGQEMCGGLGSWTVYLVGLTGELVSTQSASSSTAAPTSSSGSSTSTQPAVVTKPGHTVVVTASTTPAPSSSGSGSKVGIAVGVVVGVLALAGVIGGTILYFKQRRRREIEEEHRRNAATATYRPEPKNDSRLDAGAINARRTSIGSIADEGDFTRRILQVSKTTKAVTFHANQNFRSETQMLIATRICRKSPTFTTCSVRVTTRLRPLSWKTLPHQGQ